MLTTVCTCGNTYLHHIMAGHYSTGWLHFFFSSCSTVTCLRFTKPVCVPELWLACAFSKINFLIWRESLNSFLHFTMQYLLFWHDCCLFHCMTQAEHIKPSKKYPHKKKIATRYQTHFESPYLLKVNIHSSDFGKNMHSWNLDLYMN